MFQSHTLKKGDIREAITNYATLHRDPFRRLFNLYPRSISELDAFYASLAGEDDRTLTLSELSDLAIILSSRQGRSIGRAPHECFRNLRLAIYNHLFDMFLSNLLSDDGIMFSFVEIPSFELGSIMLRVTENVQSLFDCANTYAIYMGRFNGPTTVSIRSFVADNENTMDSVVIASVNESILKLKKNYPDHDIKKNLFEMRQYLEEQIENNDEEEEILRWFDILSQGKRFSHWNYNYCRTKIKTTLLEVMSLFWEVVKELKQKSHDDRKVILTNILHEIPNERGPNEPSCPIGVMNKFIAHLSGLHPDITVFFGPAHLFPIARVLAIKVIRSEVLKLPEHERRILADAWDAVQKEPEHQSQLVTTFLDQRREAIRESLDSTLGELVQKQIMPDLMLHAIWIDLVEIGLEQDNQVPGQAVQSSSCSSCSRR